MICDVFDVVVVPFPFSDRTATKWRPALSLTGYDAFGTDADVVTLAMVTTAKNSAWPFDVWLKDLAEAGLRRDCIVRFKFTTMSFARVEKKLGRLSRIDQTAVSTALRQLLPQRQARTKI